MSDQDVIYAERVEEGIEAIVFNQPEKRNAISADMMDRLVLLLRDADADESTKVIILKGRGDHFSSGGDLSQGATGERGPEVSRKRLRHYLEALRTVRRIAKPVIAMVDGYAVGGAFSLVLACDLVCVSDQACFVPAFCQIGIVPEMGMMKYLPELVGSQKAKEILFLGDRLSGQDMLDLGLANRLFPKATLESDTIAFAKRLASMPDASIQIAKGIMNSVADGGLEWTLEAESTASPFCTITKAHAEAVRRFKK